MKGTDIVGIVVKHQKRNKVYFIILFLTTIQTIINNIFIIFMGH